MAGMIVLLLVCDTCLSVSFLYRLIRQEHRIDRLYRQLRKSATEEDYEED